ncbi:hypothetical protein [Sorangium sp. So ce1389]|uniref:hypothetical protein n=1 Tax=Sorangium sp. So ce1389 TaxID=3133336 RepID=UPI003F62B11D
MKLRSHPHRFTISALLSLCLFACDPVVVNGIGGSGGAGGSGATIGSGGAGGSGASDASSGSGGSSGDPDVCLSTALGRNTPVTFHIRNTGATDLIIPNGECGWLPWSLTSPDGGRLPHQHDVMCDGSSDVCPGICDGIGVVRFFAGAETPFVWDGILSYDVDIYAGKYCPAVVNDDFCASDCQRYVDAAPGAYTIEVHAFDVEDEGFGSPFVKTVTFDYPEQTDVHVTFP